MIFYIQYLLLLIFVGIAKILPRKYFLKLGSFFGLLAFWIIAKRRKLTINNIKSTLHLDEKASYEMAKKSFCHFGRVAFEVLRNSSNVLTDKELMDIFEGSGEEIAKLHQIYEDSGRRLILITPHLGNFELVAQYIGLNGTPMSILGRPVNNPYIARFIKSARELFNNSYIEKGSALIGITKAIKAGRVVGLLPDQKSGSHNSQTLDFLGRPATTALGTARLAKKLDCFILPVYAIALSDSKTRLIVDEPIVFGNDESDGEIMQKINDTIGKTILQFPEQWFWMHNRWKA